MKTKGFTLIELMVVVAIVGILAIIAIPGYQEQVAKSRRAEAMRGLSDLMLKQERWRSNHIAYGTYAELGSPTEDNYTLSVPSNTATGYQLLATRAGKQIGDRCGDFIITNTNGTPVKSTSTGAANCNWP